MTNNSYAVRSQYATDSASQLLVRSVRALTGVSEGGGGVLASLGIETIFDLAGSSIFNNARQILFSASHLPEQGIDRVAGDIIDSTFEERAPKDLIAAPISVMRSIEETSAQDIKDILGLNTIQELATWPPYLAACSILNDAYGMAASITEDTERPDDLIPISRRYATERVQYDIIVMDRVLQSNQPYSVEDAPKDLLTSGAIDISNIVSAALIAKPAVGAVLTYRQSWYPQGLALGHLLHSMALAPGESTRIAMVDWTRSVRGSTTDITSQAEALSADLTRTRAMSEVTSSVAHEAQSGFSGSSSEAQQHQSGTSSGSSSVGLKTQGVLEAIGSFLFGGESVGISMGSKGTSTADSTSSTSASAWASSSGDRSLNAEMTQNITDQTHQAANSVRNRRASTVMETSQTESEKLSTRVVTNYNHMHALTVQYFEVVQIYRVVVELSRVTRCLFVPMKLVTFTEDVIRRYRGVIASAGLTPEIRALAFAQPNQLMIVAPNKDGVWTQSHLTEIKLATGDDAAMPNSPAYLPVTGLELFTAGSWDQKVKDHYEAMVITTRQGVRVTQPITENTMAGSAWSPRYFVRLEGFNATDIISLSLVKKKTSTSTGIEIDNFADAFVILLTFDIKLPDGTYASIKADAPRLALEVPVRAKAIESETVLFIMQSSLAEADIIQHLNENALYYSTAIWRSLDAATITTMLATYTLNDDPLIEVIDPMPVTVNGNYLVFRYYGRQYEDNWESFCNKHDLKNPAPIEDLIPLPSGGVFAEAVLGRSNSAEKLDITRFWNWVDSPIPILPPEINPLSAGGKANDPNIGTKNLEGQVLNIINPPSLPDPAGLAPLYNAIANGNMFRDMSGLAQTAALAQAALQAAQAGAGQATTAAGQAQQVAAQQLTDLLRTIAEVALAAGTGGAGGAAGIAGSALGVGNQGVSKNPTNAGAMINQGAAMDTKSNAVKNTTPPNSGAGNTSSNNNSRTSSGSRGGGASLGGYTSNQQAAFDAANWGGAALPIQLTAGGIAPAPKTGLGGIVQNKPSKGLTDTTAKVFSFLTKIPAELRKSKSEKLGDALIEAAAEIAKKEIESTAMAAIDEIPFAKAIKFSVKYSLVFAEGAGRAMNMHRERIQAIVDGGAKFSTSEGYTMDEYEKLKRTRQYMAIGVSSIEDVLKQGLMAVAEEVVDELIDEIADSAKNVALGMAKEIAQKIIDATLLDLVAAAAVQNSKGQVNDLRAQVYAGIAKGSMGAFFKALASEHGIENFKVIADNYGYSKDPMIAILSGLVDLAVGTPLNKLPVVMQVIQAHGGDDSTQISCSMLVDLAIRTIGKQLKENGWKFALTQKRKLELDDTEKKILMPAEISISLEFAEVTESDWDKYIGQLETDVLGFDTMLAALEGCVEVKGAYLQAKIDSEAFSSGSEQGLQDDQREIDAMATNATLAAQSLGDAFSYRYAGTELAALANTKFVPYPMTRVALRPSQQQNTWV